jgi:hypothetical protein
MAVAFVSATGNTADTGASPSNVPINGVNGGAGNALIVAAGWRDNDSQTITSITYGATTLTGLQQTAASGSGIGFAVLASPAGTENVTVNLSAASPGIHAVAFVLSGADTASLVGTHEFNVVAGVDDIADTVTSAVGGLVLSFAYIRDLVAASLTFDSGQANYAEQQGSAYTSGWSTEVGAASVTSGYTWTNTVTAALVVIPINAAAGGGSDTQLWSPVTHMARRRSMIVVPSGIIGIRAAA